MTGVAPLSLRESAAKTRLRLWLKLLKTTNHLEAQIRENLRSTFDTTLPRFDVMSALSRYEKGLKMSELSRVLRVSNGNVTGIVDRLVDDGFVLRDPVPGDRRAWLVRLTQLGVAEFQRQAVQHEIWVDQFMQDISPEHAEQMMGDLDSVTRVFSDKELS